VKHLQRMGIKTILMTEPRWGQKAANGLGENPNERLEPFMDSCRLIAKETDSGLVDHFRHWTEAEVSGTNLSQWTTDECHPNPTGHKVLADTMLPIVLKALQD
jgi:lysophospholipase L1-like esterase